MKFYMVYYIYIQIQACKAVKFGAELLDSNQPTTGVYEINHVCGDKPHLFHSHISSLQAQCDSEGWTVLLRRKANSSQQLSFRRTWSEYQHGFEDLNTEFWYGLRNIHCLTTREQVDLQVDLKYDNETEHTSTYQHFIVDGSENKYTLHIGRLLEPISGHDS